jgi:hypothetical protein
LQQPASLVLVVAVVSVYGAVRDTSGIGVVNVVGIAVARVIVIDHRVGG